MGSDLIRRSDAIDAIEILASEQDGYTWNLAIASAINSIKHHVLSAQPEPIKIQIDHELTHDEFERLRKDMADAPIVLMPSAEPEIIRCMDCKHSRFFDPCFYCYEFGGEIIVPENGFCFMAERRANESD